jgi:ankyrin repeat protein
MPPQPKGESPMNRHESLYLTISLVLIVLFLNACGTTATSEPTPTLTLKPKIAATASGPPPDSPAAPEELFDAIEEDLEAVKSILDGGVPVNAIDEHGTTALHLASANGCVDIVSYLIAVGANVNAGTKEDRFTPLHFAAYYGQQETAKMLLENGAMVDAGAATGITPLHLICEVGAPEFVEMLLEAGADPDLVSEQGFSALYLTLRMENVPTVELLLDHRADVNARFNTSQPHPNSPLALAAWMGNQEMVKLLLDHDARDPWLSDVPGFDPYDFEPLAVRWEGDRIMAGSHPFFLGAHYAKRPWVDPSTMPEDTTGTNFFTWADHSTTDELLILYIENEQGHQSGVKILLPSFIGEDGVHFRDGVTQIAKDGPFVTIRVVGNPGTHGRVILHRGNETIENEIDDEGSAIFELAKVTQNEPLTIEFLGEDGVLVKTIDLDCVTRGASVGSVFYDVWLTNP